MEITLLVGAAPYRLNAEDAAWLEALIRERCSDESGRALSIDETVWGCVLLANVLREDLARGSSPEPIELGRPHVEGLLTFVLREEDAIERGGDVLALYEALLQFRGRS